MCVLVLILVLFGDVAGIGKSGEGGFDLHVFGVDGGAGEEVFDVDVPALEGEVGGDADGELDDHGDASFEVGWWRFFEVHLKAGS